MYSTTREKDGKKASTGSFAPRGYLGVGSPRKKSNVWRRVTTAPPRMRRKNSMHAPSALPGILAIPRSFHQRLRKLRSNNVTRTGQCQSRIWGAHRHAKFARLLDIGDPVGRLSPHGRKRMASNILATFSPTR